MEELPPEAYSRLADTIDLSKFNPEAASVIRGKNPESAFIWSQGIEGFYLIGDPNNTRFNSIQVPPGMDVRSIQDDYDLCELDNADILLNTLLLYWRSMDDLQKYGSCFYAVAENTVVSLCYTGFATDSFDVMGIETCKDYRRSGLGYTLALRCIHEILERGKLPYWDCMEENIPSMKLAEKIGFLKSGEYICFGFPI